MPERTLVAGIGNIFFGDDGFGCEVVRRLAGEGLPEGVRVVDYGIRGMHLAYDLLDAWDLLVLVDALPNRGSPGHVELIEVGRADLEEQSLAEGEIDAHGMAPVAVLSSVGAMGGTLPPVVIVGAQVSDTDERIGLSPEMEGAIPAAVDAIQALLQSPLVALTGGRSQFPPRDRRRAEVR